MENRNEISAYLENLMLTLLGVLLFFFPLIIAPITTDAFTLPKQILLGVVVFLTLLLFGIKMISDGSVRLRRTPFDLPLMLFAFILFLSTLFAINRADSLIAYVPLFASILLYFLITNLARHVSSLTLLLASFVGGACVMSMLNVASFFNIKILPFTMAATQSFTTLGSFLDQAMYLFLAIPIAAYFALPVIRQLISTLGEDGHEQQKQDTSSIIKTALFGVALVILLGGFGFTLYQLFVSKTAGPLLILPFQVGFQTAFSAISQDTGRFFQGFSLGSGYGTFMTDFSRFKQALPFNINPTLWSLTFFRSSSFALELLATTGIVGLISFLFLTWKILNGARNSATRENPLFYVVLSAIIASFLLPFSPVMQTVIFIVLGLYAVSSGLKDKHNFFDIELHFVAFRKGFMPLMAEPIGSINKIEDKSFTKALPILFFLLFLITTSVIGFYSYKYVASDILFQDSLVAASQNNGLKTYNDETTAISMFPNRDAYHRIYSQTNLAIANNLASQQPAGTAPSTQTQETIYQLIQQSINAARNATVISPATSLNWQNLSSIYRSLIGFGKDAESFAVTAAQQSIALDPNNPQLYLQLGGIYYQLGQWDLAQQQFQLAISLKSDFANAYYNLGHTLESKGDLQNALVSYQNVKILVANEPESVKKIDGEIAVIQEKIGQAVAGEKITDADLKPGVNGQPPITIDKATPQLPERDPRVDLETPTATQEAR